MHVRRYVNQEVRKLIKGACKPLIDRSLGDLETKDASPEIVLFM